MSTELSPLYQQLLDYAEANPGTEARKRVGDRKHTGYLTLERGSEVAPVRVRDSRRRYQYEPVFERDLEGPRPDLEIKAANGRYVPVTAFFAGGAANRVAALSGVAACGVISANKKPIEPGTLIRRTAFIKRDGPRHEGKVREIEWSDDEPPVVVVDMKDGQVEHHSATWTAEGPWEPQAPFRTRNLNVIGPRGAIK